MEVHGDTGKIMEIKSRPVSGSVSILSKYCLTERDWMFHFQGIFSGFSESFNSRSTFFPCHKSSACLTPPTTYLLWSSCYLLKTGSYNDVKGLCLFLFSYCSSSPRISLYEFVSQFHSSERNQQLLPCPGMSKTFTTHPASSAEVD